MPNQKYIFTSWQPRSWDPRPGMSMSQSPERKTEITAPNDKAAVAMIQRSLSGRCLLVGRLTTAKGRVVARCHTVHIMMKVAWDDPPQYIDDTFDTFLALRDEDVRKRAPAKTGIFVGTSWTCISVYGPDDP